jgi:hypothetical protein
MLGMVVSVKSGRFKGRTGEVMSTGSGFFAVQLFPDASDLGGGSSSGGGGGRGGAESANLRSGQLTVLGLGRRRSLPRRQWPNPAELVRRGLVCVSAAESLTHLCHHPNTHTRTPSLVRGTVHR